MATFNKLMYRHDFATMTGGDFALCDMEDFYNVQITAEWTGLDAADGTISFLHRANTALSWNNPPGTTYTMAATPGSQAIVHGDYSDKYVGIRITANTVAAGTLDIWVSGKSDES